MTPQNRVQLAGEFTPVGGLTLNWLPGIPARRIGWRLGAAALLLFTGSVPAQAAWEVDWRRAETAARTAAQRTEQELRTRHLPAEVAPAFAATIRMTRDRARAQGVRPPPAHVLKTLSPYFSRAVLNQVRWRPPIERPSMSTLLVGWYFREGAITVNDVVLFSDARLAQDPGFWAHELTHVEQYRRYGVDGFARRYIEDWQSLEAEARQRADRVRAQLRGASRSSPGLPPPPRIYSGRPR